VRVRRHHLVGDAAADLGAAAELRGELVGEAMVPDHLDAVADLGDLRAGVPPGDRRRLADALVETRGEARELRAAGEATEQLLEELSQCVGDAAGGRASVGLGLGSLLGQLVLQARNLGPRSR
jgi:hypothetical protein